MQVFPTTEFLHRLNNARLGAPNTTVTHHDSVGSLVVCWDQGHALGVQVSELQSALVVFQTVVVCREGFDQAAQLVRLKALLRAGV